MKKVPHHFYCELYYQNFYFCMGWKRSEMKKFFNVEIEECAKGMALNTPAGIVIWIESGEAIGACVHECVHAAKFLFAQKGIISSNENDEPLAYMVQWIFDKCNTKIRKKRK